MAENGKQEQQVAGGGSGSGPSGAQNVSEKSEPKSTQAPTSSENTSTRGTQSTTTFETCCGLAGHPNNGEERKVPRKLHRSGSSVDLVMKTEPKNEAKVLILYTGGTIGMMVHDGAYRPEPNFLVGKLRGFSHLHDQEYSRRFHSEERNQPLALPGLQNEKKIIYLVHEYQPLLDSSNMTLDDYVSVADDIKHYYQDFDGFVILHGTDTMAYTASALSFMLENLGKTVIITGSQIPIGETRSDGRDNFLGALVVAGLYNIPEVSIYFHNKLFRGNRTTKVDSGSLNAFDSPNMPPLVELGIDIDVKWNSVFRQSAIAKFDIHKKMNRNVGILRMFPSITFETVKAFVYPPIEGIVLQTYGAGNAPDNRKDIMSALAAACKRGVIIVNCTQCARGSVDPLYHTGKALVDAGVIAGADMTPEAALTKLSYVLGKDEWDLVKKREMMSTNVRGELTVKREKQISLNDFSLIDAIANCMHLSTSKETEALRDTLFPSLMCAAARSGDTNALERLRDAGGVFDVADYDDRGPLHIACSEGNLPTVRYLLDHGVSVHVKDRYGATPLIDAIKFCHFDVIKLLCDAGAHIPFGAMTCGMELCKAASENSVKLLKAWLSAGADVNTADYNGRTALHVAVHHQNLESIEYLLEAGAQVRAEDVYGNTAMVEAEKVGYESVMNLLKGKSRASRLSFHSVDSKI